jgi:hypothetical protein
MWKLAKVSYIYEKMYYILYMATRGLICMYWFQYTLKGATPKAGWPTHRGGSDLDQVWYKLLPWVTLVCLLVWFGFSSRGLVWSRPYVTHAHVWLHVFWHTCAKRHQLCHSFLTAHDRCPISTSQRTEMMPCIQSYNNFNPMGQKVLTNVTGHWSPKFASWQI